jgi:2-hydroxy-6-oxonona-2,4-dienedioate hydrolase
MPKTTRLENYPERILSLDDLLALEALSTKHVLPYHEGQLVFRCWGAGKAVVLLHGGSGSWNHWARNIRALVASGREVWVPDMPGFGESSAPLNGQDADVLPEPLEQALDGLLGERPYDLVGFSFGSMVAALMAQRRPKNISKLVLMGAPALGVNNKRPFALRPWLDTPEGPQRDRIHQHNLGVLMLSRPEAVDELAVAIHGMNLARDRMHRRRLAYSDILLRTIQAIDTPIYGIWGRDDVLYRGREDALATQLGLARNLQSLQFIDAAGHWVQYEDPIGFAEALDAALI